MQNLRTRLFCIAVSWRQEVICMLLRAAQKNQRHNFLYVRLNGKLKSWVMSIKTIFKILLVASLAFPEAFGQQQNAQEDCGLRPVNTKQRKERQEHVQLSGRENFPWYVAIFKRQNKDSSFSYHCGGTIIPGVGKDIMIITAASCVTQSHKSPHVDPDFRKNIRVVVGPISSNFNANGGTSGSQKFSVKNIEINPLYEPVRLKFDAALIQLEGVVEQGKYARPACLPPNNIEDNQVRFGMVGEIAGFNWDIRRNVSEKLWFAKYPVTTGVVCESKLQMKVNEYLEFCTGYQKETTACQGDSGSGLVFQYPQDDDKYYVHGVLSYIGKTPVTTDGMCENYNIFQRVGPLLQWVKEFKERMAKQAVERATQSSVTAGQPLRQIFPEYSKVGRDFHNHFRGMHRAGPLTLTEKIQESAQRLAESLASRNSLEVPKDSIYSTNVYSLPGVVPAADAVREAIQFWYSSFSEYKREDPTPSSFTQMVWRNSQELGVGTATDGDRTTVVAQYYPKGNVYYDKGKYFERTKTFDENVKAILPGYI